MLTSAAYPHSAVETSRALGHGTFSHGWLLDETSGNLAPAFGGVTLAASGAGLIYDAPGPLGGSDRAVGFTALSSGKFDGGQILDVGVADDLVVIWVGLWTALPSAFGTMFGKASSAFANGWSVNGNTGIGVSFGIGPGSAWSSTILGTSGYLVGSWHVGAAVIERAGVDVACVGVRELFGPTTVVSTPATGIDGSSISTAVSFSLGSGPWVTGNNNFRLAAVFAGKGPGVGLGLIANIPTALQDFASYITRSDNYKAKLLRRMLPPPYRQDFGAVVPSVLTAIGQSDNLIGGLFGSDDFLPDEG